MIIVNSKKNGKKNDTQLSMKLFVVLEVVPIKVFLLFALKFIVFWELSLAVHILRPWI